MATKWLIGLGILAAVLIVLYFLGRKSVHTEIVIAATPAQVWATIIDAEKYPEWNPVMELLEGKVAIGETVKYKFSQDANNNYDINTKVKRVTAERLLNQGGGMPGILTFDHKYQLDAVDQGTKLTIHEDYRGIAVLFWNPEPVDLAYKKLAEAIKSRVTSQQNG